MTFALHAKAYGVLVNDLSPSNKIRRCGTVEHPRSKNGAYIWDGRGGFVWNWETGDMAVFGNKAEFTADEKREWIKRRREAERRLERAHELAALRASIMLRDAPLGEHGYLCFKGLKDLHGHIDADGRLLIPMRDCITGELRGLQTIAWLPDERVYKKKMLHGMKAKGAIYRIGLKSAPEHILVEGYVTGQSVAIALRKLHLRASVVCCFSDSNMVYVADKIAGKKLIYADNDQSSAGENAAIKTGLAYCMSDVVGQDANDQHLADGIMSVCKKILEVRRM